MAFEMNASKTDRVFFFSHNLIRTWFLIVKPSAGVTEEEESNLHANARADCWGGTGRKKRSRSC